ncbi:carbohydrate kinase family protein [Agarivorans sp. MS3-6]|uniref:carbohydrate kinase family protein n=1 Tax=Agarivorans sp. TSD2052 TaxID=2937286 RepID=UPI00200EC292|nr:carbohydrate kinase family protein [Agarivorans sp. TSD2052]UPW17589.1 carbohydrate kinase family protein [Agarivorans sp. TSD2052]
MSNILVAGLVNIETTLKIEGFPQHYYPVTYPFDGIQSSVSGVGFNVAKALATLGNQVDLLSLIGADMAGDQIRHAVAQLKGVDAHFDVSMQQSPQSVILYDEQGRRQIHVDLKDIQQRVYSALAFDKALALSKAVVLCNINFSRPMLSKAKKAGKLIATDVHTLADINDDYNQQFLSSADIVFLSDEQVKGDYHSVIWQIAERYQNQVIVMGLGSQGALLYTKQSAEVCHFPAMNTRSIVNTIGAGDALFSCFLHYYLKDNNAHSALQRAMLFASYKIGEAGAAQGFLNQTELDKLAVQYLQ